MNNLQKYKDNCEEELIITPLSVLRYINTLENHIAEVSKMVEEIDSLREEKQFQLTKQAKELHVKYNKICDDLEKELAELKESTRWRKVEDELPLVRGRFLVVWDSLRISCAQFLNEDENFAEFKNLTGWYTDDDCPRYINDRITHWMPLPVLKAGESICKGENCTAINGINHSVKCELEHTKIISGEL